MYTEYINGFKDYINIELGLSKLTGHAYLFDVNEFLDFFITQKYESFHIKCIEDFAKELKNRKYLSINTIVRKVMSIRVFYKYLFNTGKIKKNELKYMNPIKKEYTKPNICTEQDVNKILLSIYGMNSARNRAIILVMFDSGLRVSEVCNLLLRNVCMNKKEIIVWGKGSKERMVPTTQRCVNSICEYLKERKGDSEFLFLCNNSSNQVSRQYITNMITSLSRKSRIKHITSHTLRHGFATTLMNNGLDIYKIQRLLGHDSIDSTQRYMSVSIKRLKDICMKFHPGFK